MAGFQIQSEGEKLESETKDTLSLQRNRTEEGL